MKFGVKPIPSLQILMPDVTKDCKQAQVFLMHFGFKSLNY